ncbi:pentatricopeptide repeat-containing protein At5g46100-like [Abrus precatorius]|uniref:Pentatricopeptide repeat-containing protein At5g46100-like n=1 Tax=Abrus precatorius TaxID=3816 RepID=A0A8B8JMM1_ABRPR|nr:pentatricopeptide repeat-containing protein At5g46100-like [Abrus precatorius]XP_027332692.1 pentatricopeptide repeat-containing protein At5g46100-like [Abrus precatorius]
MASVKQRKQELLRLVEGRFIQPDVYNVIINRESRVTKALDLFSEMISKNIYADEITYNTLLHGLCLLREVKEAVALFNEMVSKSIKTSLVKKGICPSVYTYATLVDGLCRRLKKAQEIFKDLLIKGCSLDVTVYNAMINGLGKQGMIDEALSLC